MKYFLWLSDLMVEQMSRDIDICDQHITLLKSMIFHKLITFGINRHGSECNKHVSPAFYFQ